MSRKKLKKPTRPSPTAWFINPFGSVVTEPFTVVWFPGDQVHMIQCPLEEGKRLVRESTADTDVVIEEVHGVRGLAMTDPTWDRKPIVFCSNCGKKHVVDELVAEGLFNRLQRSEAANA